MKQPTICITGGHLTPAIAVIEEIRRQKLPWEIIFIGRSEAFEGGGTPAQERRLVGALGVPFYELTTGRQGYSFWKLPIGFFQSLMLLMSHRPSVVLSFGGYIALPVAIAAWALGIPVVTHEQTGDLGLTNRIIARFARRVMLARDVGVPIRQALFAPPAKPSFSADTSRPILYITGGSTGARSLNALIFPIVSKLVKSYTVIHQVGLADMAKVQAVSNRYVAADYFDVSDVAWIYRHGSLLIGRSGANTVAEAAALGIPAIFIPLPWAAGNEQAKNVQRPVDEGTAVVLDQKTLVPESLRVSIDTVMQSIDEYKTRAQIVAKHYPRDAAQRVVKEMIHI